MEKQYKCTFMARENGALGIKSHYEKLVVAVDEDAARLKLYDDFELIERFTATEVKGGEND